MSAEAADRVAAVISSRPGTPLQTSWFEFLLDGSLLESHLEKSNPGLFSLTHDRYRAVTPRRFVNNGCFCRPGTGAADRPVPGAGVQAVGERAESGAASGRQPQEPHAEAAGTESRCSHEVGPGGARERVRVPLSEEKQLCITPSLHENAEYIKPLANIIHIMLLSNVLWQLDHSCVKYAAERAPVCEQSASRGETRGAGPLHPSSYHRHGCDHLQPLVSATTL